MPPSTGSPRTNGSSPPPIYSTRFKIIAAVLVTLVAVGFVAAYLATESTDDSDTSGVDSFVEQLIPGRDTQLLQQGTVGIDLAAGWEARLVIDGVAVPEDELNVVDSLNLTEFTPGPDKVMDALPVGTVCATATVWKASTGPEDSRQVTWCFEVI